MPTENRSSNTEQMVSVPRSAADLALKLIARNLETVANDSAKRRNEKAGLAFRSALLARPAAQHQGEPVGWTYEDGKEYTACPDHAHDLRVEGIELTPVYRHPPTSDGFSAGDMADQGAKAFAARDPEVEELRRALGGMLFAFDDGVGQDWSQSLLDYARKLTPAVEFKPAE